MKLVIRKIMLIAVFAMFASASHAIQYWKDADVGSGGEWGPTWMTEDSSDSYPSSVGSQFNINEDGYNQSQYDLKWAKVYFAFSDTTWKYKNGSWGWYADRDHEHMNIFIDDVLIFDNIEVDGSHDTGYDYYSFVLTGPLLHSLKDGVVDWRVEFAENEGEHPDHNYDVYLKKAKLIAKGCVHVPDSGLSISLLGLSLLGLAAIRRKVS